MFRNALLEGPTAKLPSAGWGDAPSDRPFPAKRSVSCVWAHRRRAWDSRGPQRT